MLALTTIGLLSKPEILKKAHNEFFQKTKGKEYLSPLPKDFALHKII